jgi:hypothetical protein
VYLYESNFVFIPVFSCHKSFFNQRLCAAGVKTDGSEPIALYYITAVLQ